MALRAALLKSIWYAFTSLDTEDSGKVSKSQLKVLSHNLHSVLRIPHDPAALERHFRDGEEVSGSGRGPAPAGQSAGQPTQSGPGHCGELSAALVSRSSRVPPHS
uniref:SWAP70 N-terminal EF-hand domain-containing protein n=1 Tax=Sinocyclocheilus grahami TaxID=75366 RepID=A0A672NFS7_SINGR